MFMAAHSLSLMIMGSVYAALISNSAQFNYSDLAFHLLPFRWLDDFIIEKICDSRKALIFKLSWKKQKRISFSDELMKRTRRWSKFFCFEDHCLFFKTAWVKWNKRNCSWLLFLFFQSRRLFGDRTSNTLMNVRCFKN